MRTTTLLAIALAVFAAAASAQAYKWVDRNGRVQYGDTPPPGVNATALGAPSARLDPQPEAKPEAKKGPLTPAEQEAAFRKRQEEAEKGRQKQAQAAEQAAAKKENCALAQNQLRTLQSGMRISRTDAKGERYFLDEAQISQETAKAQQAVQQWCG